LAKPGACFTALLKNGKPHQEQSQAALLMARRSAAMPLCRKLGFKSQVSGTGGPPVKRG